MKKSIFCAFTVAAATALTGCGHSFGGGAKGIGLRATWNPDTVMPEIQLGYYETAFACVREHAEFTYEGSSEGGAATADGMSGETGIRFALKTGDQLNGYAVDIAEATSNGAKSEDAE